jgi:hypothetical protein
MNFSIPDDIYKHLEGQPNRSAYVAELVRQDMRASMSQALRSLLPKEGKQ